mmetsp:Transcript_19366/g.77395  ORF Transcript_19366/g.77395 Transcript_19366/m.77395 type:complete len:96 (-) Transcript_19366:291-578(-)
MNGHQGTAETIGQKRSRSGDQRFQRYVKSSQEEKDVCEDWYHVQDGFRYVIPYVFAFRVNCKRRWIGKTAHTDDRLTLFAILSKNAMVAERGCNG